MRGVINWYERERVESATQRGRLEAARQGRIPGGPPDVWLRSIERLLCRERATSRRSASDIRNAARRRIRSRNSRQSRTLLQTDHHHSAALVADVNNFTGFCERADRMPDAAYNRRKASPSSRRRHATQKTEWIQIQGSAIIDPPTFERAQAQSERNGDVLSGRNDKRFYVLRGLLRCGLCGSHISGCASPWTPRYRVADADRASRPRAL